MIGLAGCSRFMEEKKPVVTPVKEYKSSLTEDLGEVSRILREYFTTNSVEDEEIDRAWGSLSASLDEFQRLVKGNTSGIYTQEELKMFFSKYVLKKEVSENLTTKVFLLKRGLIGGEANKMTNLEIVRLQKLMLILNEEMKNLKSHFKFLFLQRYIDLQDSTHWEKLNGAIDEFGRAGVRLLGEIDLVAQGYSLVDLQRLMESWDEFLSINSDQRTLFMGERWSRVLPILNKIKRMLIGDIERDQTPEEINEIWRLVLKSFKIYLVYENGLKEKQDWFAPSEFLNLKWIIDEGLSLLSDCLKLKKTPQIYLSELDEVILDVVKYAGFKLPIKERTLTSSYRRILARFIDGTPATPTVISTEQIDTFKITLSRLMNSQLALVKIFLIKPTLTKREFLDNLNGMKKSLLFSSLTDREEDSEATQYWERLTKVFGSDLDLRWNTSNQLVLTPKYNQNYTYKEATTTHLIYFFTHELMRAYIQDSSRRKTKEYLTTNELKLAYQEFESLGSELGAFDLRVPDSAERTTEEADLFSSFGNGDSLIQWNEFVSEVALLFSGGFNQYLTVRSQYKVLGCELPVKDYFGAPYLGFNCFSSHLRNVLKKSNSGSVKMVHYLGQLSFEEWKPVYADLMTVSRQCPKDRKGIETADLRTLLVVLSYVDTLYRVYDKDLSGGFNTIEIKAAEPRFHAFIYNAMIEKLKKEEPKKYKWLTQFGFDWHKIVPSVFEYLLHNGKAPDSSELIAFSWERYKGEISSGWRGEVFDREEVKRSQIIRVFGELKKQMGSQTVLCDQKRN